jgi:hypothetical protein
MIRVIFQCFVIALIVLGTVHSAPVRANDGKGDMVVISARPTLPYDDATISSVALKVLRHIVQARSDIHAQELRHAQKELKVAHSMVDIIEAMDPTDKIRDRIFVAYKHLAYERAEAVLKDLLPIYTSLDDIEVLEPMDKVREHVNKAKQHLEKGNNQGAAEELKMANDQLFFTEIDIPLRDTRKHVLNAQAFLVKMETQKADVELKSAEDGVQFLSAWDTMPGTQARTSFLRATGSYISGRMEAAKADLSEAKAFLEKEAETAEAADRTEIEKLIKDVEMIQAKLTTFDKQTEGEIKDLYARIRAVAAKKVTIFRTSHGGEEK